ncbi:MAG: hypothetical protein KGI00_01035 [Candidatus Micrarchaeota archaeon]|nr:hypothetical protein [Candidatus Micrarchaeota archaeon]MDE1823878.1 hypothetical protein [Candidatus Micrarchaeota archaeon]MDE1849292.1 hypothetical protein [Candidatus Micrarchaeota archaeon]
MELECGKITRYVLPAVRASIAEKMSMTKRYRQGEIAEKLGIVQVAVSKYLNGRYSSEVAKIKGRIERKGLANAIVAGIEMGEPSEKIVLRIDELCNALAES